MRRTILIFSAIAASLLILLNLRKLSLLSVDADGEVWTVVFAIACVVIGAILGSVMLRQKPSVDNAVTDIDPQQALQKLGITSREYEVLRLVAEGHSNQEISNALFISESTVKTHVSNVLMKLDARRRTQAVQRAKKLKIL